MATPYPGLRDRLAGRQQGPSMTGADIRSRLLGTWGDEMRQPDPGDRMQMRDQQLRSEGMTPLPRSRADTGAPPMTGTFPSSDTTTLQAPKPEPRPSGPPMQEIYPNVSPVYAVKSRAATGGQFTPEARTDMYKTPTHMYFTESPVEGVGGQYSPPSRIPGLREFFQVQGGKNPFRGADMWVRNYKNPDETDEVMRHEYLHKNYYENLNPAERARWNWNHKNLAAPGTIDYVNQNYGSKPFKGKPTATESYSFTGQDGPPEHMTTEQIERHYPGVYETGVQNPMREQMRNPTANKYWDKLTGSWRSK